MIACNLDKNVGTPGFQYCVHWFLASQAPSTCHLPHCDHHVALLLCGLYDVPSLLGPKAWSRASCGHWLGQGCLENYWKNHFEKTNKPSKYPQKKYQFNTAVHVVRCCWSLAMPGDNASCIGRWRGEGWVIFSWGRGPLQFITDFIWFQKVYITRSIYIYTGSVYDIFIYLYKTIYVCCSLQSHTMSNRGRSAIMILVTSLQGFIEELHKTPDCKDWKVVSDFVP